MSDRTSNYSVQGFNIVTILKRLEAATSRLEDITIYEQQKNSSESAPGPSSSEPEKDIPVTGSPVSVSPSDTQAVQKTEAVKEESPIVVNFQEFLDKYVIPLETKSEELDSDVGDIVKFLVAGFNEEKKVLKIISLSKPTPDLSAYIGPIQTEIKNVMDYKEKYRGKFMNHINAISEFVANLGWIVIPCNGGNNKPILSYLADINESTQFWTNRILKDFKDTDKAHVEWAKQLIAIQNGLKEYINEYHGCGLAFNVQGGIPIKEAAEAVKSAASAPSSGGPPPPPPPPPMPASSIYEDNKEEPSKESGLAAVFSSINKGTDITKGLRKVDKSEMTHKNPELRSAPIKPSVPPKPPKKSSALSGKAAVKKAEPKKELNDSKWMVSNFEDDHEITINGEMDHSVFIGKCTNATVKIVGKVNAITVSECKNIGILTDGMISGIDIIKTTKFQLQPLGLAPLINIDQGHEGEIYLNKNTLESQVFTSQSTAINVYNADPKDDDADFKENPLPEQLIHTYDPSTGKFVSAVVDASL